MSKRIFLLILTVLLILTGCKKEVPQKENPTPPEAESTLEVLFIDVGQADSALISCDGHYMLIDGGNVEDSSRIASILMAREIDFIDVIVGTHAHEDHIGGLAGALNVASAGRVISPTLEYDSKAFESFKKYAEEKGGGLTLPVAGETFLVGDAEVEILSPMLEYEDTNNTSVVVKISHGENSFLFMGDAERVVEGDLLDASADLSCDVLKVGHHGSETSSSYRFIREAMPSVAVISVGTDNSYGHPHEEVISRFEDAESTILRTDLLGDITITSDKKEIKWSSDKSVTVPDKEEKGVYIGNVKSNIFHSETCSSLPAEYNRIYFDTKAEAKAAGYSACSRCKP